VDLHLSAPPPTNRRTDLDWLRVLLFAGLILYHVGLMFALWTPFEIRSDHRASWVEVALMSTHPWRMCLLFLISGVATRYAFDKLGSAKLAVNRSIQLLPPLLFGVALIVPLQGYIALTANLGYTKPYLTYVAELLGNGHRVIWEGKRYATPVFAHLWFVAYLWTYVMILAATLALAPRFVAWVQRRLEAVVSGPGLLLWPLAFLLVARFTLFPVFSVTLQLTDDWYNHAVSASMFLFGFLTGRTAKVWDQFKTLRWPALTLAVFAYVGYSAMAWGKGSPEYVELSNPLMHMLYPVVIWGGVVTVLGFARDALTWNTKALAYLNGAIFTYYIVHQPAMFMLMARVKTLGLHPAAEFMIVLTGTAAVCGVVHEVVRGLGPAGLLLGAPRGRPAPGWAVAVRGGVSRLMGERPAPAVPAESRV
jgi:hypothetical protein